MSLELDLVDSLNALQYPGKFVDNDCLSPALDEGVRNANYRDVVCWLAHELHGLRKTDEVVSPEVEDPSEFVMELSAMLKELGCPYVRFVAGPLSERFDTRESRLALLDYLVTELMSTKMSIRNRHSEDTSYIIPKFETHTARALDQLSRDLCLGKPPENISPKALFDKLNFKVEEAMRQVKPAVLSEPMLTVEKPLSDEQWQKLEALHDDLEAEYNLRRQVLLTRLEVTIQSFQWSDKMQSKENEILKRFQQKMQEIEPYKYGGDATNIVALLAARKDLAIIEKTSSANVRKNTASKIQKHVIGSVPDRGGRAHEHAPPPPEMPSWQQQRAGGAPRGGGGRGGNFRGGRGGGGGGGRGGGAPFEQRPQFQDSGRGHNQGHNHGQGAGRDLGWMAGSGRVQGTGWNQAQQDQHRNQGGNFGGGDGSGNEGRGRGRGNYHGGRGRSNYHRGGGGGNYQRN